ncbi:MAG: TetM/TetW/TetO/TetS family tetracycline resistance ribosomal protection protein [Lachnospiraceae bacterium]|nr:TetM/TetW/TetO/TetS family tetracycline resistance ribosomal protection protein [Lachnospiraceae bacterium]
MKNIVIGMLAHVDAGKTTLSEALLYSTGAIRTLGRVDNRNAFLDTDSMERARGITIFSKQARFSLDSYSVTLLDTPGHVDFSAEMERTLQVLDYAILVISGADGVQGHTKTLWRLLKHYHIPTFIFVNKMDQQGTNRQLILEQLHNMLSDSIIDFSVKSAIDTEAVALTDEALLNKHLAGEELTAADIASVIAARRLFPCFFGSALKIKGISELIDGLATYIKAKDYPLDFGAKVYKITRDTQGNRLTHLKITGGRLISRMSVTDTEKVNQIRLYSGEKYTTANELDAGNICTVIGLESTFAGQSLGIDVPSNIPLLEPVLTYKLLILDGTDPLLAIPKLRLLEEEDPKLHIVWNELLKEIHIQVMGAVQIEILRTVIAERFDIQVDFGVGNIVYKETITNTVEGVGHFEPLRHYAEVHLIMEPGEPGSGITCRADCEEASLDRNWQRLIMTHLKERTHCGVLTGSPLTDVVISLVAGRAHQKHTEGGDFRQATYRAIRQGLMQADSVLLEPYYSFTLELPQSAVGRAMTDLERMHADFELKETDATSDYAVISGNAPVSAFTEYQNEFIAYTKGLGKLYLEQGGYKPCHNADKVIADIGYDAERDTNNPSSSVFCSHGSGDVVPWYEVFDYMHIESILALRTKGASGTDKTSGLQVRDNHEASELYLGTEEIDAILRRTSFANSNTKETKHYRPFSKTKINDTVSYGYKGKETVQSNGTSYLLVDGYNIIFSWSELKELSITNLDAARVKLLDIMCNYQAMKKCELIVVFDAYRVQNHATEFLDYHNIHVVYTKEAETADSYIERFAHEHGRKHYVRVATSDRLEQVIITGQGCHMVSAAEFEREVKEQEEMLRKEYLDREFK